MSSTVPKQHKPSQQRTAGVLIASTRAALGVYEDTTGPVIIDWLREHGFDTAEAVVVPDGPPVGAALKALLTQAHAVIVTSGGTGLSPSDQTPEMTLPLLDREIPGLMEALRSKGMEKTPMAALSRGYAGLAGNTLVVNLPGSPGGVMDGLSVLEPVIGHVLDQVNGKNGH